MMDPYNSTSNTNNVDAAGGQGGPPQRLPLPPVSSPRSVYGRSPTASETWASKSQRLHRPVPSPAHNMTEEQIEAMLSNFATQDALTGNKTWTRIVVEKFLSKVSSSKCVRASAAFRFRFQSGRERRWNMCNCCKFMNSGSSPSVSFLSSRSGRLLCSTPGTFQGGAASPADAWRDPP
jgi:hypothetical protein